MEPFWPRRERLEWELQALSSKYNYRRIGGDPGEPGELAVQVEFPLDDGTATPLTVHFPELYPYFRFMIDAPELDLAHHQHPFQQHLCLIPRGTVNWCLSHTLLDYLDTQVPEVIRAGETEDVELARALEAHQAEPFSDYHDYSRGVMLLIDGSWDIPREVRGGRLVIGLRQSNPHFQDISLMLVRAVEDDDNNTLAETDARLAARFEGTRYGRWIRVDEPIQEETAPRFFDAAASIDPQVNSQMWQNVTGGSFKLVSVRFPEEAAHRDGRSGTGWVSGLCVRRSRKRSKKRRRRYRPPEVERHLVRAGRAGIEDSGARIPELQRLRDHRIAVVGLGCIGAPAAIEFAKLGVERLQLVDHDFVDPAATVRWPLGLGAFGQNKVDALAGFVEGSFPRVEVRRHLIRLGQVRRSTAPHELPVLESLIDDASLIFDATAEHGVQRFLSLLARQAGIPYVWVWGTQGGWGGVVGRCTQGPDEACWMCVQMADGTNLFAAPPEDPEGALQAAGCGDVTFTGAGFDMQTISMAGVRMACSLLSGEGAYPARPWNVEVLSFRGEDGGPSPPRWETHRIERHESCSRCGVKP